MSIWFRNDKRLPQARLAIVSYIIVGMIGVLLLGFWKLQVIDSDRYGVLAERNRVRSIPIIAPRGRMLDRDGRVLVDNYPSFSVLLLRDDPALVEKSLPAIADGLGISIDDLHDQLANTKNLPKFQPIVIKPEATNADVAFIESHRADIPLLEMLMVARRRYLPNGFMGHASGYVGEVSEAQIEASDGRLRPGDLAGKTGLERQYNESTDRHRRHAPRDRQQRRQRSRPSFNPGSHPRQANHADHRLRPAANRRAVSGATPRCSRRSRSPHRRNSGDGQPPHARPQRFRRANFQGRMEEA